MSAAYNSQSLKKVWKDGQSKAMFENDGWAKMSAQTNVHINIFGWKNSDINMSRSHAGNADAQIVVSASAMQNLHTSY